MEQRRFGWPHAIAVLGSVAIATAGLLFWLSLRSAEKAGSMFARSPAAAAEKIEQIARAFRTGTVQSTFLSYATRVAGSTYLQFASLDQTEVFRREDSARTLWGSLDLPTVVVEAVAPVRYTYYLDLDGEWQFRLEGDRIHVTAPPIGFNRPALDPSEVRFEVRQDSILRDEQVVLDKLKQGLSPMIAERARENVELVREVGRRRTEEFVANWLFRDFGEEARDYVVVVTFADEVTLEDERPLEIEGLDRLEGRTKLRVPELPGSSAERRPGAGPGAPDS